MGDDLLSSPRIFINVGVRASVTSISVVSEVPHLDKSSILALDSVPEHQVVVGGSYVGLELAQVALGFGASELVGPLANKRGLPVAQGEMSGSGKKSERVSMQLVTTRELAGVVRRSGRRPFFVGEDGAIAEFREDDGGGADARQDTGESL